MKYSMCLWSSLPGLHTSLPGISPYLNMAVTTTYVHVPLVPSHKTGHRSLTHRWHPTKAQTKALLLGFLSKKLKTELAQLKINTVSSHVS